MFSTSLVVSVAGALVAVAPLPAQDSTAVLATLAPGRVVRVRMEGQGPYTGTLLHFDRDSVVLVQHGLDTVRVNTRSVTRLDLYAGERHNVGGATLKGSIIGGGIGFLMGAVSAAAQEEGDWTYVPPGELIAGSVLGGAVFGAGIGAIVGLVTKSTRWERINLSTVALVPGPTGGTGAAVQVVFRF